MNSSKEKAQGKNEYVGLITRSVFEFPWLAAERACGCWDWKAAGSRVPEPALRAKEEAGKNAVHGLLANTATEISSRSFVKQLLQKQNRPRWAGYFSRLCSTLLEELAH
jgi:hypothetical protein